MSFAEVAHEVDQPSFQETPDQRFHNLVHDLRALFLHMEDHVPKRQRLSLDERALILGDHDDSKRMVETFFRPALGRTEGKLSTNKTWAARIKNEYADLLQGLASYAQAVHTRESNSLLKESMAAKELAGFCEHIVRFCKTHGAKPAELGSAVSIAANDLTPLAL